MLQHYVLGLFGYLLNTQPSSAALLKPLGFWSLLFGPAFFYFANHDALGDRTTVAGWPTSSSERTLYWQDSLNTGAQLIIMCFSLSFLLFYFVFAKQLAYSYTLTHALLLYACVPACSVSRALTEVSNEMHNLRKRTMQLAQLAAGTSGLKDEAGKVRCHTHGCCWGALSLC